MNEAQRGLQRIERLAEVRQSYVTAAEAGVRDAENFLRHFEELAAENARKIQTAREEIAYLSHTTGDAIQSQEKYVFCLNAKGRQIMENVEKARQTLESRRGVWREAMRDKKIIERLQERRLQEWQHIVDVREQKDTDEMTVGRYARNQFSSESDRPDEPVGDSASGRSSHSRAGERSH